VLFDKTVSNSVRQCCQIASKFTCAKRKNIPENRKQF
jgi:hypothetical protein